MTRFIENYLGEKEIVIKDEIATLQEGVLYSILTGAVGYCLISGQLFASRWEEINPLAIDDIARRLVQHYTIPEKAVETYDGIIQYCEMPNYILKGYCKDYCRSWQYTQDTRLGDNPKQVLEAVLTARSLRFNEQQIDEEAEAILHNEWEWDLDPFIEL